jgi:hypothetical protein
VGAGLTLKVAAALAFASDTASIVLMEIVDNLVMLYVPGAMEAGLSTLLFWGSLAASLVIAGVVAFPLNRWLIAGGRDTPSSTRTTTEAGARERAAGPGRGWPVRQAPERAGTRDRPGS